ncbi:hypothetical protein PsorP6_012572 [Peronosclerospora sorghi]|uniref:Uncharacterized protein n=1 Tax=Peronosclerospora sorghi TaxID=230839 RepID=A0ACC0WFX8_9STRA|nr:hypothetical protein PsorP6_012572 [Peronosclerospora sorghi]
MTWTSIGIVSVAYYALGAAKTQSIRTRDASMFEATEEEGNVGGAILAVVAILVGTLMVAFGHRFMYETIFATGFALGAISMSITTERMLVDESFASLGAWIAFIAGGVCCGGVALWVHPKSNFLVSVAGGLTLAMLVTNSAAVYVFPRRTTQVFTLLCVVCAVLFAALDFRYGNVVQLVGIHLSGAAMLVWGIGFFIGQFPFPNDLEKYATEDGAGEFVYNLPTAWWAYLAGILVIAALGLCLRLRTMMRRSVVEDENEGFRAHGGGNPSEAMGYKRQHSSMDTMDQCEPMVRDSTARRSSYPTQSFCRLYSRNSEAEAMRMMRAKFLKARALSVEAKNRSVEGPSVQSPRT